MLKCIIVDDEELARRLLKSYVEKLDFLELVGDFEGPLEAMTTLKKEDIDVLFLDIQMPDLKGTHFAKMIAPTTKIIFTTAYAEYALQGFELNALDYLLKPISFDRFLTAVQKIPISQQQESSKNTIIVKSGYHLYKVRFEDILYIESDNEYVIFHTVTNKIMSHQRLKSLEQILPSNIFQRVHRSHIVNKKLVTALKGKELFIGAIKIPISNQYIEAVREKLFK